MLTACKVSGSDATAATKILISQSGSSSAINSEETTETVVAATKETQKDTVTLTQTVKETTGTTTEAVETTAPAVTTKVAAEPAATTKAPAATTKTPVGTTAATQVETAASTTVPLVAITAVPATDYTAMCVEIRSKLITILEANGKWDPNYAEDAIGWGQAWWGCGYFEENGMSTQDVAQYYYDGKFAGTTKIATSIDCYVLDGNIYLDYKGYFPA